jgi:hypothetical protein
MTNKSDRKTKFLGLSMAQKQKIQYYVTHSRKNYCIIEAYIISQCWTHPCIDFDITVIHFG